jgi:hypothetical protein
VSEHDADPPVRVSADIGHNIALKSQLQSDATAAGNTCAP